VPQVHRWDTLRDPVLRRRWDTPLDRAGGRQVLTPRNLWPVVAEVYTMGCPGQDTLQYTLGYITIHDRIHIRAEGEGDKDWY